MNLSLFIARRLYRGNQCGRHASRPAVLIAKAGMAIGLAVMIVAVSIIIGFKQQVRDKIAGFGAHIRVSSMESASSYGDVPIAVDDTLLRILCGQPGVSHVQRYSLKLGMVKTSEAFQGMVLKGVGQEFDASFFRRHLLEGEMPVFSDSVSGNRVLVSRAVADKLKLRLGDKIDTYFMEEQIRARRLTICGIYETNYAEYDNLFLLTDLHLVNRLNNWELPYAGGAELTLGEYGRLEEVTWQLAARLDSLGTDRGVDYCVQNIEQLNPQVFAWLEVLDVNVWVILVLMIGVSGFTMVSGLLIIILEHTSTIGVLKSLGAGNLLVRRTFLWFAVLLIGRGMLWGNVLGVGLCLLQRCTGLFKLDPQIYYMDTVPVSGSVAVWLLLNAGTLLVSVLMLVGPSYLITHILPARAMRYD